MAKGNQNIWVNGDKAEVDLPLRGLEYGDGVFRTLLKKQGVLLDLDLHLRKLESDARRIDLELDSIEALRQEIAAFTKTEDECVLKIILCRKSGDRGYVPQSNQCDRILRKSRVQSFSENTENLYETGVSLGVSTIKLSSQSALAGLKHLNRLENVLASARLGSDFEHVMCDADGQVVCGTKSNIFVVKGGEVKTPALEGCGVAGVTRDQLMSVCESLEIPLTVCALSLDELCHADEIWLSNSVLGVLPVAQFNGNAQPQSKPIYRSVCQNIDHAHRLN